MAEQIYYCESCGGIMEFDVATQALKCPNCRTVIDIENHPEDVIEHRLDISAMSKVRVEEKETVTMVCTGCGAPIEVGQNTSALHCPYCGSSYVMADKQLETIKPDGVVTFKITKQQAMDTFRKWVKGRALAPTQLKNLYQHGQFQGMYVPYWTFDADASASYTAMGGKHRRVETKDKDGNVRTETVTDWYPTSGYVQNFFDDVLVCATDRAEKGLISGIDNFDTKNMPSYSPDYMSGYMSETYSVDLETGHKKAIDYMKSGLRRMAEQDVLSRYDEVKNVFLKTNFADETYKYVYVPIYTTNYSFKGKNYTVVVNGETGAIRGEYPKSVFKIIAIIIAVILGLLLLFKALSGNASGAQSKDDVVNSQQLCYNVVEDCDYQELYSDDKVYEVTYQELYDDILVS